MRIAIVGGGIGGLTAALCLLRLGHQVCLFEQADALAEVGAGLQLSPNAMHVFRALGLEQRLLTSASAPQAWQLRDGVTGKSVFRVPMQPAVRARWGADYLVCHRADLVALLAERLQDDPNFDLKLGRSVGHISELKDFDLQVLADGLHSRLQRQVVEAGAARYTGNLAWRMTIPAEALPSQLKPENTACVWAGQGRHSVTYFLRDQCLINFVGIVERPGLNDAQDRDSWAWHAPKADLQRDFENWHASLSALIEAAPERVGQWALFDRPALPRWHKGTAVLLGDAAHGMLPTMAQGAAMAIEDAWVLAACLDQVDVETSLQHYFEQRIARVSRVQRQAVANARDWHRPQGVARSLHFNAMSLATKLRPSVLMDRLDWIYGIDVTLKLV